MIKVAIVDDSALIRNILTRIISHEKDMTVVGAVGDPYAARELIRNTNPDVLTLDIEMPRMDGLAFLEKIMKLRPMPVIMISTLGESGSIATLRALELGAIDVVAKPKIDIERTLDAYAATLIEKIRAAATSRPRSLLPQQIAAPPTGSRNPALRQHSTEQILAIGASTGGTEAIKFVLMGMPPDAPAIVIVQHMPVAFTKSFAKRLDEVSRMTVKEAEDGDRLLGGHAYVAPGDAHMRVVRSGANYLLKLDNGEEVSGHRPSVDVLFHSVAENVGNHTCGVLLTGMGKDGAMGLKAMHDAGAWTCAQDEESSVVFGMPKEAIRLGATDAVLPLAEIPGQLISHFQGAYQRTRI
ncbi:chemotaxis response regulator protein-glutamate methylesterase [Chitinimonas prasina]|uniref:Protein-glutamate methylesterase/protein-glutamine glutaminase n=1 Tax=Chitinimonas prasina TaxID=1434937 RepID=A0ABQ5YNL1_9NEIS|nr:chemotaxis response regulator protein-glutamate methylesterase [Chitinimonas prasina]GLR14965.1 chemotaxis response regulator protein-glutamate methylesterase [Chitinimonas prasina]